MKKITAIILFAASLATAWSEEIIFIPYGSGNYTGVTWWTNAGTPSAVKVWEGIQAANSNFAFLARGGGTNKGTSFSFRSINVTDSATNFVADLSGANFQKLLATNNVNFAHATNGPGAVEIRIWPNGASRVLSFPTNWVWRGTNGFGVTNGQYQCVLTNANSKAATLRVSADNSLYQTNVVAEVSLGAP